VLKLIDFKLENKAYDEDAKRIRLKFADGLCSLRKNNKILTFLTIIMGVEI
jgi:hypothetical protein